MRTYEIDMASYQLTYDNERDFLEDYTNNRNPDLVRKVVKVVLMAIKRKKASVIPFEITYRKGLLTPYEHLIIHKKNYLKVLKSSLDVMINTDEDWMLCAEMRDAIKKLEK